MTWVTLTIPKARCLALSCFWSSLMTCQNRWRTIVPFLLTVRQRTRPGKTSQQPLWVYPMTSLAASSWADIWGMLFNAEKSEHMMICGRGLKGVAPQPSVSMAGIPIPQVKIHKHLGVIFNDTLTWSNHIDKVYERCAQRVGILRRLRRTFPSRALRRIYVGAVLPIMEYACPVWSGGPVAKLIHLHESFCRCTRENTHLSILRQRYSDTEAKFSNQTQPRKCAPTANLDTQLTAFCTRSTFCTRWSKPLAEFWLQIWLILRVLHTSRLESASAQNQCLAHSSFSSCSLFEFSPFQRNAHDFAV